MKRDMDLVRRIVRATEELPADGELNELPGVPDEVFFEHARWMQEAGLVHGHVLEYMGAPGVVLITRLTWEGCEFADATRSDTLWTKAKANVLKPGASFTFDLLKEWLKSEISQGLPTFRALGQ